jgi:hypothetical protein
MKSCTIVDDIERDGTFALQNSSENVVSAGGDCVGCAPAWGVVVAMIAVLRRSVEQEGSSNDGLSAMVEVWLRSPWWSVKRGAPR